MASRATTELLTWLQVRGVGPRGAIQAVHGTAPKQPTDRDWVAARETAEAIIGSCDSHGIGVVGWFDKPFPPRLRTIPQPPALLYVLGDIRVAASANAAAIVGTRNPTVDGEKTTRNVAKRLGEAGWVVVSGLAVGIDTVAHEEALKASAPTIAVLGNGLDTVYPSRNRHLASQIVEGGGLIVAEVPPGTKVNARQLVNRDRLQSGLSDITVICQAGTTSGAMHTALFAVEQRRPLYVPEVPADSHQEQDAGIALLQRAAPAVLASVLPAWKRASRSATSSTKPPALVLRPRVLADLVAGTPGLPAATSQAQLFELP